MTAPDAKTAPATIFAAWADFGPTTGGAFYDDASASFDDAVDNYAEARAAGYPAIVWRMDTPQHGRAGMMTDVTDDADNCIRRRFNGCRGPLPDWLYSQAVAAE